MPFSKIEMIKKREFKIVAIILDGAYSFLLMLKKTVKIMIEFSIILSCVDAYNVYESK